MKNEKITEKIFSLINLKKDIDYQDPDMLFIENELKKIPNTELSNFYIYLLGENKYFNSGGILMRTMLKPAINDYAIILKEKVWEEKDIKTKTNTLLSKIFSIASMLNGRKMTAQKIYNFIEFAVSSPENIVCIVEGEKQKLLSEIEIKILKKYLKIDYLIEQAIENKEYEAKENITTAYKSFYTEDFFNDRKPQISFSLPEPQKF